MDAILAPTRPNPLLAGLQFSWTTLLLIVAINTGIALVLWFSDPRPFWHPLVTVQIFGLSIAYCVNAAAPWDHSSPVWRLTIASAIGALIGIVLVIFGKGYSLSYVKAEPTFFLYNLLTAWGNGLLISLMFYVKRRETRAAAALHRAEAERHLLSKQAIEAELKLMQAQVEPHFLFNTLASVQYLTESDPKRAGTMLSHLIAYLRAALPQLRASASTLGREVALAEAYLNVMQMRIGPRLAFTIDVPADLRDQPFAPNLLISLVENAIKHGIEPCADGGALTVAASRVDDAVVVTVTDTGCGLAASARTAGQGVGLANVRERLAALYGARGRIALEAVAPHGTRATLSLPFEPSTGA
ncbi:MAG TPA: histidine kinase [Casimicrobiaceae bacterium]|nr:histidine kinase [Casimicrobiaceae bacterium]